MYSTCNNRISGYLRVMIFSANSILKSGIDAQLFLRNKYTVFTMGGTIALRSVNTIFFRRASSAARKNPPDIRYN